MVQVALEAADSLAKEGWNVRVVNARFIKPLDEAMLQQLGEARMPIVTIEEGALLGGFGAAVLEYYARESVDGLHVRTMGIPDYFVEHGSVKEQRKEVGLTAENLAAQVTELLQAANPPKRQRA
jgi:1-deoxy-D-xylulose-5-phosphate synthase